jgi:heme/copper-type cytochrome/quinol oxidase subunit 2
MSARTVVFLACVAACVVAHVAILVSIARRAPGTAAPGVPAPRRGLEILLGVLSTLALALVLTATWDRMQQREEPRPTLRVAR